MPFDATPTNTTADVLRRARAVIGTPDKICQFDMSLNGQHCTIGAFEAIGAYPSEALEFFVRANNFPDRSSVMTAHDWAIECHGEEKAHAIIMGWFDKAIALAEAQ